MLSGNSSTGTGLAINVDLVRCIKKGKCITKNKCT